MTTTMMQNGKLRKSLAEQIDRLDHILDVVQIFHLKIHEIDKAIERLKTRALRENRLDDMNEEVIKRRLNTYYEETFQTLSFYPEDVVYDINAGQAPTDVLRDIAFRLSELQHALTLPQPSAIQEMAR